MHENNTSTPEVRPATPILASQVTESNWLAHLKQCRDNGTLDRLSVALANRQDVRVRRSSGAMQWWTLNNWGHAGRSWSVKLEHVDGDLFKTIRLEDLLAWNPELDVANEWKRPEHARRGDL